MGPERSFGGLGRTFGLHRQASSGPDAPPIPVTRARLGRVVKYFTPYWAHWLAIFVCVAIASGLGVLPPLCVRAILDHALPNGDAHLLYMMVGAIIGLTLTSGLIGVLQNYLNTRVGELIVRDLRNQLYQHLQQQSLGFYTSTRAGEIVSRLNNDVGAVQQVATGTLVAILSNALTLTATIIVIVKMDPWLALLSVAIVPTFYLPTRLVGRIRRRLSRQTQEQRAELVTFMEERLNIGAMLLTKTFGQTEADADQFSRQNDRLVALGIRQALAGRWLFMCLSVISVCGPALIYLYGGGKVMREELTVGTLIAFVAYLSNLYRPMAQLANVYVDLQGALAVFERIFEYLDAEPEVRDRPDAVELTHVDGPIVFEDVVFEYPPLARPSGDADGVGPEESNGHRALDGVSFEIQPGEKCALVGPSGAGKTTLTYLVARFFDPTAGRITIAGHDLRGVTQESLRRHFGIVSQDTFLFHATIRENLLYARPTATLEEMRTAAKSANIDGFISELPEGYDTVVGERGFRVSGGEKQRLAIARALLKDPQILILDEATSHLDATSEAAIQEALVTLLEGRTAIIIAHRLSTVLRADKIVVLERGHIVEMGRHADLVAQQGLYAQFCAQQFVPLAEDIEAGQGLPPWAGPT